MATPAQAAPGCGSLPFVFLFSIVFTLLTVPGSKPPSSFSQPRPQAALRACLALHVEIYAISQHASNHSRPLSSCSGQLLRLQPFDTLLTVPGSTPRPYQLATPAGDSLAFHARAPPRQLLPAVAICGISSAGQASFCCCVPNRGHRIGECSQQFRWRQS